jgi:cysteine-rich repeat protein
MVKCRPVNEERIVMRFFLAISVIFAAACDNPDPIAPPTDDAGSVALDASDPSADAALDATVPVEDAGQTLDAAVQDDAGQVVSDSGPGDVCGDGNLSGDEECDDGNLFNGDGCNQDCLDETGNRFDQDGDCFCVEAPCIGSVNPGCGALAEGDCDDEEAGFYPGAADLPDALMLDSNCDGIDGSIGQSVFLDLEGGDDAHAGLLPSEPLRSIGAAFTAASQNGRTWILIAGTAQLGGLPNWSLSVNLAGGYSAASGFTRLANGRAEFHLQDSRGLTIYSSLEPARLQRLHFQSADGGNGSVGSTAVRIGSGRVQFSDCRLVSGDGIGGAPGPFGSNGANGGAGSSGMSGGSTGGGNCGNTSLRVGAPGGVNACIFRNEPAGRGGRGGNGGLAVGNGGDGLNGAGPLAGSGGSHGAFRGNGGNGVAGDLGINGSDGSGGDNSLSISGNGSVSGQDGTYGGNAGCGGAGGGGGGAGGNVYNNCDYYGGAGGGGGGGAAGGNRGQGGGAGGASVALAIFGDGRAELSDCAFVTGNGGVGGAGGSGGSGGQGGIGGNGGPGGTHNRTGGNGGNGGVGGHGGQGGGGAGGASIAVVCTGNGQASHSNSSYNIGNGGNGGNANSAGDDGLSQQSVGCP